VQRAIADSLLMDGRTHELINCIAVKTYSQYNAPNGAWLCRRGHNVNPKSYCGQHTKSKPLV